MKVFQVLQRVVLQVFARMFLRRIQIGLNSNDDGTLIRNAISIGMVGGSSGNPIVMSAAKAFRLAPLYLALLSFSSSVIIVGATLSLLPINPDNVIIQTMISSLAWGAAGFLISKNEIARVMSKVRGEVKGKNQVPSRKLSLLIIKGGVG